MVGSNSMALRQHAYAVFSASRRASEGGRGGQASDRRPLPGFGPGGARVMEAKSAGLAKPPGVAPAIAAGRPGAAGASAQTSGQASGQIPGQASSQVMPAAGSDLAEASRPALLAPPSPSVPAGEPSQERIRLRAYEIFLARGGVGDDPVGDWLQAEAQLRRAGRSDGA